MGGLKEGEDDDEPNGYQEIPISKIEIIEQKVKLIGEANKNNKE